MVSSRMDESGKYQTALQSTPEFGCGWSITTRLEVEPRQGEAGVYTVRPQTRTERARIGSTLFSLSHSSGVYSTTEVYARHL
jgi:hypothetical protein